MFFSNKFCSLASITTGVLHTYAAPTSRTQSCAILAPGNYSIQSVALPGELVGVGQPFSEGFTLALEKAPPPGNLGVWTLTNADQGGYTILNVELGRNVTTGALPESQLPLPVLPVPVTHGITYAIQCAGNGEYVIKAVDADLLWTTLPGTGIADMEEGVASMVMEPASGSEEQHFIFNAL
ncbi:hypothetical protein HYPSUDRAFT_76045 [Hypholoma sublateritium FD-334 SS-4]|uniref:Carbohydrate-binding module family 13 protein n=1 Tax=Hypholoma sublateritium (strain FD-334 SS-4) TaxID=945553 RepID=A0A0D2P307_HYPSF|nr:hypothetical protein HYPSUDRAFT_76045 [Hypholoma sublateritium FD-334 SS-4]